MIIDFLKFIGTCFIVGTICMGLGIGSYFCFGALTIHFVKQECKNCEWKNG